MPYSGPGRYRHYKGGFYEVIGLGIAEGSQRGMARLIREETGHIEAYVLYRPESGEGQEFLAEHHGDFWVRPFYEFNGKATVLADGSKVERFQKVDEA